MPPPTSKTTSNATAEVRRFEGRMAGAAPRERALIRNTGFFSE